METGKWWVTSQGALPPTFLSDGKKFHLGSLLLGKCQVLLIQVFIPNKLLACKAKLKCSTGMARAARARDLDWPLAGMAVTTLPWNTGVTAVSIFPRCGQVCSSLRNYFFPDFLKISASLKEDKHCNRFTWSSFPPPLSWLTALHFM